MQINRRKFVKVSGLWVLGLGALPALKAIAGTKADGLADSEAVSKVNWALTIDINKCQEGCTECISACHDTHNVPQLDNVAKEVKWIWKENCQNVFPQLEQKFGNEKIKNKSVIVLCNHCEKPSCIRVCPTKATFKKDSGIVAMDYHRCIGCRYCMAACPYGARSFNFKDPRPYLTEYNLEF
ncbi:MAG: 4Fe-4S dicluster domain-containing protein, partial [Bacillota bacterium]|nr:4Fe-4S dicluster domain-containing protein [Bacillota bacterium]